MNYNFKAIEEKWRNYYERENPFRFNSDPSKPKYYCLEMFPYPSGSLHMGHVRNYTIGDVIARYKRMRGYDVLHPIGWDAFGLPAENAAIEKKIHPAKWTFSNIDEMRKQLKALGFSYDWEREICTAHKDYYRWGQWFFLKLYEKGLVYRKKAVVNWDPIDQTVLAKEQVIEGRAWRSGALVEQKAIEQWYFKITDYAEELITELDHLPGWPEKVKTMQRNWIGKSIGAKINFVFLGKNGEDREKDLFEKDFSEKLFPIFTTRPDTIYGATFMAIAFDHENLIDYLPSDDPEKIEEIIEFVTKCKKINQHTDFEKEGCFTGSWVKNPVNEERLPLYVANFVLAEYGTGAIMSVPAHDERDFDFAKKYNLPIKPVIKKHGNQTDGSLKEAYSGEGVLINSGKFDGISTREAIEKVTNFLVENGWGEKQINYKLKDWLISRQRYWGNPIPMLKKTDGEFVPVDEADLPVELPLNIEIERAGSPLDRDDFKKVKINGEEFIREVDTMDTFTCSSWYFLRYVDPHNEQAVFSENKVNHYLPVDQYIGGIEHACLHLLYARFFHKVLRDLGYLESNEPFQNLLTQGMVVSPSYYSPAAQKYFTVKEIRQAGNAEICPETGESLVVKIEKMSKSKKNGVDPQEMVDEYGSDSVRLFSLFAAPVVKDLEWNEKGIEGCQRFIQKIVRWSNHLLALKEHPDQFFSTGLTQSTESELSELKIKKLKQYLHRMIYKVEQDFDRMHFNTAIATMMSFINTVTQIEIKDQSTLEQSMEVLKSLLILLSPLAPFVSEEINELVFGGSLIQDHPWPKWEKQYLDQETQTVVLQVNGKVRGRIEVSSQESQDKILSTAKQHDNVRKWLENKKLVKEIYIPGRLINFVVL